MTSLRIFFIGGAIAYRGLFNWLSPWIFVPTFLVALAPVSLHLAEAEEYGKGWLNGGNRFEYLVPVLVGDVITARGHVADVYEKAGGSGNLLFIIFETEYTNQRGDLVARLRGTMIRR